MAEERDQNQGNRRRRIISINSQIDKIQDASLRDYTQNLDRRISSLADRQSRLLNQLYDNIEREEKARLKESFNDRQEAMRQSLEEWRSYNQSIRSDLSLADRFAADVLYWNRRRNLRDLEREARYRFDDIAEEAENAANDISDSFSGVSDALREWSTALNVNSLASGLEDSQKSMRDIRVEMQRYVALSEEEWKNYREYSNQLSKNSDYAIANTEYLEKMTEVLKVYNDKDFASGIMEYSAKLGYFGVNPDQLAGVYDLSDYNSDMVNLAMSQMARIANTEGLGTSADQLASVISDNTDIIKLRAAGDSELAEQMMQSAMIIETASNANDINGLTDELFNIMNTPVSEWSTSMYALLGRQGADLLESGQIDKAAKLFATNLNKQLSMYSTDSARMEYLNSLEFSNTALAASLVDPQSLTDFLGSMEQVDTLLAEEANATEKFLDTWKNTGATRLEKLNNEFHTSAIGSTLDDISNELDITLAEGMLITSGLIDIGKLLGKGVKGIGSKLGLGGKGAASASGAASPVLSGAKKTLSTVAPYAAGAAPGLAMSGYGIYGMVEGVDAAKSAGSEWQEGDYGRSIAYGADTAALVGAGGTALVAGGIGTAAGISAAAGGATAGAAALAGLSAIPVAGWIAAGVLAVGLGVKAILDNTEKVNGFAEALDRTRDSFKDQVSKEIKARKDELWAIKESIDLYGEEYNYRQALLELGYSENTLEGINTAEAAEDFTQQVTNALTDVEAAANDKIDADIDKAVADLAVADEKRDQFITSAVDTLLGSDYEAKTNTTEWRNVKGFLDTLAEGMEGSAKDEFVSMYTGALNSHGGISDEELRGILGDKGAGASWRAFWSTDVDLKKAFMDNASDLTAYNKAISYYLDGDESLMIDDSAIKALKADETVLALLTGYYEAWKTAQNDSVKSALTDLYTQEMEVLKNSKYYENYHKDEYTGYAQEMGIPGYRSGLDRVPYDNFLARLHEDEAVLTAEEAEVWRQATAGWTPNDKSSSMNSTGNVVINQIDVGPEEPDDASNEEIIDTLKWLAKEIKKSITDLKSEDDAKMNSNQLLQLMLKSRLNSSPSNNIFSFVR